jgi:hypothetical protein
MELPHHRCTFKILNARWLRQRDVETRRVRLWHRLLAPPREFTHTIALSLVNCAPPRRSLASRGPCRRRGTSQGKRAV